MKLFRCRLFLIFMRLSADPASRATFYAVIMGQTGSGNGVSALGNVFGVRTGRMCELFWIPISLGLQIAIAALLLYLAIRFVSPTRRRK